jgi:aryl-alcohol dehydrogenase-like predicted oxidoreductase
MNKEMTFPRMMLGTVQLGLNYGIANTAGKPGEEMAFSILKTALESGINCFDTAADYGDSEKVIGKFLKQYDIKRSDIMIVTKFKLGKINRSEACSRIKKILENSLQNLGTDYIDVLLMHDANEYADYGSEITTALHDLINEKRIRSAGASCYKFSEIEDLVKSDLYEAFQIPINILDTRITRSEAAGKLKKKLVFARSVFLQGLFFLDPALLKGNLQEVAGYIEEIKVIASELGISVAELAAAYVNSLDYVDSLVVGADNPDQVKENLRLVNSRKLTPDIINDIEKRTAGAPGWLFMPSLWDKQR